MYVTKKGDLQTRMRIYVSMKRKPTHCEEMDPIPEEQKT